MFFRSLANNALTHRSSGIQARWRHGVVQRLARTQGSGIRSIAVQPAFSSFSVVGSNLFDRFSSVQRPASSVQRPASSVQRPASSVQRPASSVQRLGASF